MSDNSRKNVTLFLVDVQKDFHPPNGSLAVPNADKDAERIAKLIKESLSEGKSYSIDRIVCTMDTHNVLHIAHRGFWFKGDDYKNHGRKIHPDPFTLISNKDIKDQVWIPRPDIKIRCSLDVNGNNQISSEILRECLDDDGFVNLSIWADRYTAKLEDSGKFQLIIWPEHCIVGTEGHSLMDEVRLALREWELHTGKTAKFVMKGLQNLTEMYSVLEAEVPICDKTTFNHDLFDSLTKQTTESDEIWIAGQAASHCVNFTTRHLVSKMPKADVERVIVLTDCMSSVAGFEKAGAKFFEDMKDQGVQLRTTEEIKIK